MAFQDQMSTCLKVGLWIGDTEYLLTARPVRTTRARIIYLRNDYKALMARIELAVQEQFASLASEPSTAFPTRPAIAPPPREALAPQPETPFATIDNITAHSPAELAGLKIGDKIVRFGVVNWLNHERLRKVAQVVSQNEGVCRFTIRIHQDIDSW
jgi:26S proteasome regulatory subunit N4